MRRGSLWLTLAFSTAMASTPSALRADVVVNTSLNLTSFTISPSTVLPGVFASVFAQAADNLGDFDAEFNSNTDGPTSISTSPVLAPYSSASATADGSALTTSSASGVNIPSLDAAVLPTSTDGDSQLSGSFEIVDNSSPCNGTCTNPVNVTFSATLTGDQSLFTDPYGISADSEVTFQLLLADNDSSGNYLGNTPFLFYDNPLSIGSDTTLSMPLSQTLSGSASLLTNTDYSFFLETDAESDGFDSTPEPSSLLLFATLVASLAACRLRRG